MRHDCLDSLMQEVRPEACGCHNRISHIMFPSVDQCQDKFNKLQGYPYAYQEEEEDEWDTDDE